MKRDGSVVKQIWVNDKRGQYIFLKGNPCFHLWCVTKEALDNIDKNDLKHQKIYYQYKIYSSTITPWEAFWTYLLHILEFSINCVIHLHICSKYFPTTLQRTNRLYQLSEITNEIASSQSLWSCKFPNSFLPKLNQRICLSYYSPNQNLLAIILLRRKFL